MRFPSESYVEKVTAAQLLPMGKQTIVEMETVSGKLMNEMEIGEGTWLIAMPKLAGRLSSEEQYLLLYQW